MSSIGKGNCGGTDVLEHPVYTPKGLPPIRLKNRPVNPGLTESLKEQIAVWLKDCVIQFRRSFSLEFPSSSLSGKRTANGDGSLTFELLIL